MIDERAGNTNPRTGPPVAGSACASHGPAYRPIFLSPEQQDAVGEIKSFLNDDTRRVFSLHGLAGTGKSTLLARIARTPLNPLVATPTGKSAAVLRGKFDVPARTIHSLFHRLKSETQCADGRRDLEFSPRLQDGSLAGKVLLIDESSMVTTELVEQLLRTGVRIIAFGDPGQLPPVKGESGFLRADVMLRTIHRQAADSPIIRQAHTVRAGGDYAPDGDAFQVVAKGNLDHLRQADVVLCFRNATRRYLNQLIRQTVGVDGLARRRVTDDTFNPATEFPRRGDRVVVLKNAPRHDLWNGDIVKLAEDLVPDEITAQLLTGDSIVEVRNVRFVGMPSVIPPGYEDVLLDFGYALTVHKAQGSEWPSVLVHDEFPSRDPQRSRWVYTALTRASQRIVVNSRCR